MIIEKLGNGLTVIVKTVPNRVVTLDAWVNTGSANENESVNGVSHYLEHMLFKGTPKYGVGELDKTITGVGGVWNAGTAKDFTHYYVTLAAPFFATALDAISEMMQRALIDRGEFDKEKLVILEEYRRKQDSPVGLLYDELYDLTFNRGPYRLPVLGTSDSISALDRDTMHDYYERYYTPDNMVFLVVGDVGPSAVLPQVRDAFGGFDRQCRPLGVAETVTDTNAGGQRVVAKDVNETYMALSWPGPAIAQQEDVLALDMAATILGEGRSSRLYRVLKEEKQFVHYVGAGYPSHKNKSLFTVVAMLDSRHRGEAVEAAVNVLHGLAVTPPTAAEMAKARRLLSNQLYFRMETNGGQSDLIGYYYTVTGSTRFLDNYIPCIEKLTADDVSAVCAKYLLPHEPNLVVIQPAEAKEQR